MVTSERSAQTHNYSHMSAFDQVTDLLARCGTETGVLPPTALYNEGWMLRLVLHWFDHHRTVEHPLAMLEGSSWYSEPLLASRFFGKSRGDPRAEGWTNADAVIGHFRLRAGGRGDVEVVPTARQSLWLRQSSAAPCPLAQRTLPASTRPRETSHVLPTS